MCGICGIISSSPIDETEMNSVFRMQEAMLHRGPDSAGNFTGSQICLGMRRLSIIDLAGGAQPLFNEDRSLTLVANGEIYNFMELRSQLKSTGHSFNTNSDCETILHLYEDHGPDCVHKLRGMFAFALWDSKRKRLLLARDRMGEKPLYMHEKNGRIIFASEMKALLASGHISFELDPESVDLYFHYQYVPEPKTILKNVRKLDAAHLVVVDVDPWNVNEVAYWRMEDAPPLEGDPATLIREQLETISELVIRSDVPVGVALSGGLDSSAVAALAARKYPGVMEAFSVGYPGRPQNDERGAAKRLADHLGMPFHDIELSEQDMVALFPDLVTLQDDPIADIAGFGYYSVMKIARAHGVPVVLQGQAGDELFWGYLELRMAARYTKKKRLILSDNRNPLWQYMGFEFPKDLKRSTIGHWVRTWGGIKSGWKAFKTHRSSPAEQIFYEDVNPDFSAASREVRDKYTSTFVERLDGAGPAGIFTFAHPWPDTDLTLTRLVCDTYLRENGIAQGDRLSMASSVELRLPLADYLLVETVIGLRKTQSDLHLPPKAWLKESVKDVLPDWVLRRPKRGFAPPVRDWHTALFNAYGEDLIDGYLVQNKVIKPEAGLEWSDGPFPRGHVVPLSFKALVLEQWCRTMLN
jgi:asparagine synthase (glutamine-hydrolysing)